MEIVLAVLFILGFVSPAYTEDDGSSRLLTEYGDPGAAEQVSVQTADQDQVRSIDIYDRRENE